MAPEDLLTGVLCRLKKVRDKMLARYKETRDTEPSCAKTYEECAELLTKFIITELDNGDVEPKKEALDG